MRSACCLALLLVALSCEGTPNIPGVPGIPGVSAPSAPSSVADVQRIIGHIQSVSEAFEDLTPEQEHYIGRAVAAEILARYKLYDDAAAVGYVNLVGQTLALASDRPETFAGYHFFILDDEGLNALAAPGGLIFVTRGMLRLCQSEDQLAAVLAHEVIHVADEHGIRALKQSKQWSALSKIAFESLGDVQQALGAIGVDLSKNLLQHGYSRGLEREADESGIELMGRVGYDPHAMLELLNRAKARLGPRSDNRSHPHLEERIQDATEAMPAAKQPPSPARTSRFEKQLARARAS